MHVKYWPTRIPQYYILLYEHGLATSGLNAKEVVYKRNETVKTPVPGGICFV
jgi:hypothetical protein